MAFASMMPQYYWLKRDLKPNLIKLIDDRTKAGDIADSTEWHSSIRAVSALALGEIRDSRAIDPLIALFESNKNIDDSSTPSYRQSAPYRQKEAVRALGKIGVRRLDVVNLLLQGLNEQDEEVKAASAKALGQLRVEQAIAPVTKLLKNPSDHVRCEAATTLGIFGAKSHAATPLLIETIKSILPDEDNFSVDNARQAATLALGEIGAYEAKDFLTQLSQNSDYSWAAEKSLQRLNAGKTGPFTDEERSECYSDWRIVRQISVGQIE
jgi:HEAT repeat protein